MRLVHKMASRLPFPESNVTISEDYSCAAIAKVCSTESVFSYSFFLRLHTMRMLFAKSLLAVVKLIGHVLLFVLKLLVQKITGGPKREVGEF